MPALERQRQWAQGQRGVHSVFQYSLKDGRKTLPTCSLGIYISVYLFFHSLCLCRLENKLWEIFLHYLDPRDPVHACRLGGKFFNLLSYLSGLLFHVCNCLG